MGRDYCRSPTWTSSASTMPEWRNVSVLQNMLSPLLENVLLAIWQTMWLQHNGAQAHSRINVCWHPNNIFLRRWIGHGGSVAWSAWLSDLNLLDFYLWGHLKSIVYSEPVPDVQTLQQHVHVACDATKVTQKIFRPDCTVYDKKITVPSVCWEFFVSQVT